MGYDPQVKGYRKSSHTTYQLNYHFVFITKYRKPALRGDVAVRLRGILVLKFWIHISQEEQLRRFKAREKVPFKKYKITPDDYRNREKWNDYELAASEMFQRTSTDYAPWRLVPGNNKRIARIEVLRTVCRALRKRLSQDGR